MDDVDVECEKLARYFLPPAASRGLIEELASEIQCAIDDWLDSHRDEVRAK